MALKELKVASVAMCLAVTDVLQTEEGQRTPIGDHSDKLLAVLRSVAALHRLLDMARDDPAAFRKWADGRTRPDLWLVADNDGPAVA